MATFKRSFDIDEVNLYHRGMRQHLGGETRTDRYFHKITSRAFGVRYGDHDDEMTRVRLGTVEAYLMLGNLAAADGLDGVDVVDLADSLDQQTYDVAEILYGENGLFPFEPPTLRDSCRNAIYLHSIRVEPEFRGLGLGKLLTNCVVDYHDPSRFAAAILFVNSQFGLPPNDPFKKSTKASGNRKLESLYRTFGFKSLDGQPGYMIRDMAGFEAKGK